MAFVLSSWVPDQSLEALGRYKYGSESYIAKAPNPSGPNCVFAGKTVGSLSFRRRTLVICLKPAIPALWKVERQIQEQQTTIFVRLNNV